MPERSYELSFALYLLVGRVNTLRSLTIVDGVRSASDLVLDPRFFEASFEDSDQAQFYAGLMADRASFQTRSAAKQRDLLGEGG